MSALTAIVAITGVLAAGIIYGTDGPSEPARPRLSMALGSVPR